MHQPFTRLIKLFVASLLLCGLAACVSEKSVPLSTSLLQEPLTIAVLPLAYTGFESNSEVLSYSSGIRNLLASFLDAHPQMVVFNREKIKQELLQAQLSQFAHIESNSPNLASADYVLTGNYQVKNSLLFRGLDIRLIEVNTGLIVVQQHVAETALNAYDLGIFINRFGVQLQKKFNLNPFENAAQYLPCRNAAWQPFLQAESLRDIAITLENPRQRAEKLAEAQKLLSQSATGFCSLGKQFIENEIQSVINEQNVLNAF